MKLIKDCIVRVVEDPQKAAAMMDDGWEKLGEPKKAKKDFGDFGKWKSNIFTTCSGTSLGKYRDMSS